MIVIQYFFFLFIFLFTPNQSLIISETKIFENQNITIHNLTKAKYYFHINISRKLKEVILPRYIQILVDQDEQGFFDKRYVISYYQKDSTFTNIKQISNGLPTSYIWLSKAQIKDGFYFSVEDLYQNCKYKIQIIPKLYIELTFSSNTYSYYVSEENKIMQFMINGEDNIKPKLNDKLIFWAHGNKKSRVETNLNISDYRKHSKYNTFALKNLKFQEYVFTVEGEIGDILDVGFLCFNIYNFCKNCINDHGILYYGFLKRDYLNDICFAQGSDFANELYKNIKFLDKSNISLEEYTDNNRKCVKLPKELKELNESFFSFYYLSESFREYKRPLYYSYLEKGILYHQKIEEKQIMYYFPLRLENNFDNITYYIETDKTYGYKSKANVYISIMIDNTEKKIQLKQSFGVFTYTLTKNEIINVSNPIDIRNIKLIYECIKGGKGYNFYYPCTFDIRLYTDKTKFNNNLYENNPIVIRNNDVHKFNLNFNNFYIEKLSGDISLFANQKNYKCNNYIKNNIYEFNDTENINNLNVNILAKKNSIYQMIKFNENTKKELSVGDNYLLKLKKGNKYLFRFYVKLIQEKHYSLIPFEIERDRCIPYRNIYINFYPINCELQINEDSEYIKEIKYSNQNNISGIFYQKIKFTKYYYFEYNVYPQEIINSDTCLLYLSSYDMDISDFYPEESIILKENQTQLFAFNDEVKSLNFSYYFAEIKDDIRININLINEANFNMYIFIGNLSNKYIYEFFNTSKIIDINGNDLYHFCEYENQICQIFIIMTKMNNINNNKFNKVENDTIVAINIIHMNNVIENIKKTISYALFFYSYLFSVIVGYLLYFSFEKVKIKRAIRKKDEAFELIDIDKVNNELIIKI